MNWINNKVDWMPQNSFAHTDINRIEGNINGLDNTYNIGGTATYSIGSYTTALLTVSTPGDIVFWEDVVFASHNPSKIVLYQFYSELNNDIVEFMQGSASWRDRVPQIHRIDTLILNKNDNYSETLLTSYSLAGIKAKIWTKDTAPKIADNIPTGSHVIIRYAVAVGSQSSPVPYGQRAMGQITVNLTVKVLPQ